MAYELTGVEARVLGSLVEKDVTTPDYYPLSLNALVNACNQKSSRDPVMNLDEDTVRSALDSLSAHGLADQARSSDSRVPKFEHHLQEVFNFTRAETAVICLLLLRGPQTPGEIRSRSERLYRFEELDDVISALQRLSQREPPLVTLLPRQPGTKEARYAHLFSGEVASATELPAVAGSGSGANGDRVAALESEVEMLKSEVAELKSQFASFRKQFE